MTNYSNSRLSLYENCRFAYDLHYNQGYDSPYETIEAFMGSRVHEALEKLYTDVQNDKVDSLEELISFYDRNWDEKWHDNIINSSGRDEFIHHDDGIDCITDYYNRFHPFDQQSIAGIETDEILRLPDGNTWSVRIDRFAFKGDTFYVCDYKTGRRMKSQYDADTDRQLGMYARWVKERYGKDKKVKLFWHMLRFNKDVESSRSNFDLDILMDKVLREIREIEENDDWSPNPSRLCDWCIYRHKCPIFCNEHQD